ncbi:Mu transposase C-terminal domain-containing protein [Paracoccus sp. 1_MG-2023]|uniref:Mu transposase C-terminal domain-containing protein n=1 Tax=unclassified Paracoccus (in: a-proteobacteria) TaxID=2688777 RepID=UPI001C07F68F|nr:MULTISPECIES: Mu transposase C-terminal domain-containing protein [unclassified Paracoccus (in: a-proteobacteria)]MBU2957164.1 DDE-type integrase/transposase/recombinase [Paracoccus sp. C2R09]MDO6670341.1 Mu transposase C-terminal domain-containing protein [Paracoccus sp. 1_MG-2023]
MNYIYRVSETDCLEIAGSKHRLIRSDKTGSVWSRLDDDNVRLSFTGEELLRLLAAPDTRLKRGHFSDQSAFLRLRCDYQYLQTLQLEKQSRILWQSSCAKLFLEAEARGDTTRTETSVQGILRKLEQDVNAAEHSGQDVGRTLRAGQGYVTRKFPCARTLLEWVRMYERAGRSPLVFLRKRRSSPSPRKLTAEVESLLAECVYSFLERNGPLPEEIVRQVRERFEVENTKRAGAGLPCLPVPSARTVRRRIEALDPFEVVVQRKGIEAARRKFGSYEEGLPADYPLQRVEMDEWQIDLATLLGDSGALDGLPPEDRAKFEVGRRWIYVAIDCATRCILGFRIVVTPNSQDAIRTLNLIIQDKTPIAEAAGCESRWDQSGGIGVLVTDQGSAFAAEVFRMAVADMGATYEAPPAGVPKLRARIERIFRTFGQQLAPMLIGRTFSNPIERGDYPSEQWAALTDDELAEIFTLFIVDIYHNTPHAGLKGETPANAWKRLSAEQGVTPPPDANQRRVVFGIPLTRKLDRHGVRVFGINYTCPKLQEVLMRSGGGDIPIRLDPDDLTHVSVCLGHEWHSAQAVPRAVHGLSLDEWQTIVRDLRTRFREQAILSEDIVREARKKIRAIDARARQLRRIQPQHWTAEALDRAESRLFLGLRFGTEGSAASGDLEQPEGRKRPNPDDLLGDVIEPPNAPKSPNNGGLASSASAPTANDDDDWSFDD